MKRSEGEVLKKGEEEVLKKGEEEASVKKNEEAVVKTELTENEYLSKQMRKKEQEEALRSGTLLDLYHYRMDTKRSGRHKMLVFTRFSGVLRIHFCSICNPKFLNPRFVRIAHFKAGVQDNKVENTTAMQVYSPRLKEEMGKLFWTRT